jgi:hypothetical protein
MRVTRDFAAAHVAAAERSGDAARVRCLFLNDIRWWPYDATSGRFIPLDQGAIPATWRGTNSGPADRVPPTRGSLVRPEQWQFQISFDPAGGGTPIRVIVPEESARAILETLAEGLQRRSASQSKAVPWRVLKRYATTIAASFSAISRSLSRLA